MRVKPPSRPVGMPFTTYCRVSAEVAAAAYGVMPEEFYQPAFDWIVRTRFGVCDGSREEEVFVFTVMLKNAEAVMWHQVEALSGSDTVQ